METPMMMEPRPAAPDTHILPGFLPVPGQGVLAVNAFVIRAAEPVLVDTGLAVLSAEFMTALRQVIDPRELRWIWLTHADADHLGNLAAVLAEAPQARLVTNFLGMGKLNMLGQPVERAYLLNPGQALNVGDRELVAFRPPTYDAPETTGLLDTRSRALLSSDSFGALLEAPAEDARAVAPEALQAGLTTWATIDAPWLHAVHPGRFAAALDEVRRMEPSVVLSSHLPPASGLTEVLLAHLFQAREAAPFVGPDQAALEQMMAAA